MPAALEHVWRWFTELAAVRTSNGFGPNPIGYVEIWAWAVLTGARPSPWEAALLRRIDSAVMVVLQSKDRGAEEPENEVEADNTEGVKSVMGILKARSRAVFGKPTK